MTIDQNTNASNDQNLGQDQTNAQASAHSQADRDRVEKVLDYLEDDDVSTTSKVCGVLAWCSTVYFSVKGIIAVFAMLYAILLGALGSVAAVILTVVLCVIVVPFMVEGMFILAGGVCYYVGTGVNWTVNKISSLFSRKPKVEQETPVSDAAQAATA